METRPPERPLILASSSVFRQSLLLRYQVDFNVDSPDIDESSLINETPSNYVSRLSLEKAKIVAERQAHSLVIASDQCCVLDGIISDKPGDHKTATQQLQKSAGCKVSFITGVCVMDSHTGNYQVDTIPFHVHFRDLSTDEIERYLIVEQPYNCAGSFKAEGLGITLFKKLEGDDPTALIGLPLIRLSEMLREFGLNLP